MFSPGGPLRPTFRDRLSLDRQFLASDGSPYVAGSEIQIDAGAIAIEARPN